MHRVIYAVVMAMAVSTFATSVATAQDRIGDWNVAVIGTTDAKHEAEGGAELNGGVFTVRAGGDDIWNAADQFTYIYQEISGDFEMGIAVHRLELTNEWSKAGIMARQTLEPGSINVLAAVRGSEDLVTFQYRPAANAASSSRRIVEDAGAFDFPVGIYMKKEGDTFSGDWSEGDLNWSGDPTHNDGTPTGTYSLPLDEPYLVGIAVTSHAAGVITEADVEVLMASFALAVEPSGKATTAWGALKDAAR